ncbi:MAG: hypothetical protein Terrestrivirus11_20 [Terrestrivirus sp.]|uniref:Uncharacterized protein n=1 Tax=Terrestrivirus sp. TaxID=2487775 RepID=A0A3G4ZTA6_9VIRU|nr:MAG: hypothetical protein Terrestrivirus11_20 [Terrestrivirus sp.]
MESYNKPYPKSKNNFQCIGPCYQAGTTIVHPVTLEYVTDRNNPFCPVRQWELIDRDTGKKTTLTTDICYQPTETKDLSGKEFEINILTPNIDFNDAQFLKIYYNIYSYEDAISFVSEKKYLPAFTKLRIIDCALAAYGKDLNIIDHRTVDFFIEMINKIWMPEIYKNIEKYVDMHDGKIRLSRQHDQHDQQDQQEEKEINQDDAKIKYNFIKSKFITNDEIFKFLMKYLKHRKDKWTEIQHHVMNIRNDLIVYIENKIKNTVE